MRLITAILAMTALTASCMDAAGSRAFVPRSDGRPIYNAISYGPHRDGQRPGVKDPSADEMLEDLRLMQPHWNLIRIYGSTGFASTMLEVIEENDLDIRVMLGTWIGPVEDSPEGSAANRREIEATIGLANRFPDLVSAVSVGNETQVFWSGHSVALDTLLHYVDHIRERIDVPVTVADDYNFWNKPESVKLSSRIDFITLHAHPLWNGQQIEGALDWMKEQLAGIEEMHPGRLIVIGETGWATSAEETGEQGELIMGIPGEEEQKVYYDAVRRWAESGERIVFFFEAFDENWKGGDNPYHVEKHWGLFRADRSPKAAIGASTSLSR